MFRDALALDRASVRSVDEDGHLHVSLTPISKANVCGYYGREIPDWQVLGLDADKTYQLYRHPQELEKAAATFAGKPLLFGHKPVTADDHDYEMTVGSVTGPIWKAPYLMAALDVWAGPAIKAIETSEQKELSSAYRYRADMTPGVTPDGTRYDGVMRDISANHVALVPQGRAGKDVVVGDAAQRTFEDIFMPKSKTLAGALALGTIMQYLRPKMAQDATIDITPVFAGLTKKDFPAKKAKMAADLKAITKGKLAKDADIEDVAEVLEAIAPMLAEEDPAEEANVTVDDEDAQLKAALKAKGYSDEEIAAICAKTTPASAADETAEEKAKREAAEKEKDKAMDAKLKDMVSKAAMDSAITSAVKAATETANKTQREIREAEKLVREDVGELTGAFDSAADVFAAALKIRGVALDGVPPDAFGALYRALPKKDTRTERKTAPAMDAAGAKAFVEMFPGASEIRVL